MFLKLQTNVTYREKTKLKVYPVREKNNDNNNRLLQIWKWPILMVYASTLGRTLQELLLSLILVYCIV